MTETLEQKLPERPLKILVGEDNEINRIIMEHLLTTRGHQVVLAVDGVDALEKLECEDFDVVLMDIRMPVMNGDEAVKIIREGKKRIKPDIPVFALTAYDLDRELDKFMRAGFDGCLSKPINEAELERRLEGIKHSADALGAGL